MVSPNPILPRKIDVIWNITRVCPWDCANCCVDAIHVTKNGGDIRLRQDALTRSDSVAFKDGQGAVYDQAIGFLQSQGIELSLEGKLRILRNLEGIETKIDFSGGDPLASSETLVVMREASNRFGKANVTLTATGAGLSRYDPDLFAPLIGELNFTYDNVVYTGNGHRPSGYAKQNLHVAAKFRKAGVLTRAECPLSVHNCTRQTLARLYLDLHESGIDKLLVMRLFPVGRGRLVSTDIPTIDQYRMAIDVLRDMEALLGTPRVNIQCALRFLDNQNLADNPCDLMRESYGLMPDGTLLASPWAYDFHGQPLDDVFVLGNLANTPIAEILSTEKAQSHLRRADENFGHCKVFSYIYSEKADSFERLVDFADPLYTPAIVGR